MKQKSDSSKLVTKNFLKNEFISFERKIDGKLTRLKEEIDENAKKYRDEILTGLDGVMGELKTMREETTIGAHQISELRERVDNHEGRIVNLEKPL